MNVKTMVGIAVACAAGAFFAGWQLKPAPDPLHADRDEAADDEHRPLLGAEATRRMQVEAELRTEREHSASLTREIARLRASRAPSGGAPTGAASRPEKAGPTSAAYAPAALAKAVSGVDWAAAGEAVTHLVPILAKLEDAFRTGADLDPTEFAGISKWNSPLAELALTMQAADVPGTGTNGAFTHPAVMVNLIAAALENAEKPLTAAQLEMLVEFGDRFLADDARRRQAYTEETISLQRTYDEALLKDRFYASAVALLTPAQRDILHPAALRGRLGVDIFSSGVIWHPLAKPVSFATRADLAPRMKALLVAQLEIPAELHDVVEDAAAAWARSFTDEELKLADDPVLRKSAEMTGGLIAGWARIELARAAARHMLALDKALLERLPSDSAAAKTLRRGAPGIVIPVKK